MTRRMINSLIIALLGLTAFAVMPIHPAEAGFMSLPGGWTIDLTYCTNGFTAKVNIPASITPNTNHRVYIITASPDAWLLGGEVVNYNSDAAGTGGFSVSKVFYWRAPQAVGTPVASNAVRFQNTTLINSNGPDTGDTVQNCEVPPIPPEVLQHIEVDGRINKDYGQTGAVYCRTNGIEVLYSIDGDPREGQRALFVSNVQYMTIGIPLVDTVLAQSKDGYVLYRLTSGEFLFVAPDLEPGKLYQFRWLGC